MKASMRSRTTHPSSFCHTSTTLPTLLIIAILHFKLLTKIISRTYTMMLTIRCYRQAWPLPGALEAKARRRGEDEGQILTILRIASGHGTGTSLDRQSLVAQSEEE